MKLWAALACAAVALAAPATASATALYVRTDGNDANDGLANSPQGALRNIQTALSQARPGDVVEIQQGVYSEALTVSVAGTADQHITVRGNGAVALDGQNTLEYGIVTGGGANFVDFENLEVRNYTVIAFYFYSFDNRFTNLDVHHNKRVAEGNGDYGFGRQTFVGCKFHHHVTADAGGWDAGVIRAFYAQGIAFERCEFYENTTNIVLWLAHTQGTATIRNCVFRDNTGSATGTGDLIGTEIAENNTFYGNGGGALTTWDDRAGSVKIWRNNIAVRNGFGYAKAVGYDWGTVTAENNLAFANRDGQFSGLDVESGNLVADPLFVDEPSRDLRLRTGSPAIDAGVPTGAPFSGVAPDLGAFELRYVYVRTDGNDANDGLSNSPQGALRNIQTALSRAQPGDVIEVEAGVYNEGLSVNVAGTAAQHITVRGNGAVALDGQNILEYGIVTGGGANFVDFENLEVRNYTVIAFYFYSFDNRFTNLDVHHNKRVAEGNGDYGFGRQTFAGCRFHHHVTADAGGWDAGVIRVYYGSGITFERCEFYENTTNIVLWLAHTQDTATIRNCVFRDNTGGSIGTGDLIGTAIVENNTFYGNAGTALGTWDDRPGSVKIWRNNIAVRNGAGYGKAVGYDAGTVTAENNLAFANRDLDFGSFDVASGNFVADPLFVSEATRDLRLAAFSPALDEGLDVGLPYFGAAPDLGAFEKTKVDVRLVLDRAPTATGFYTGPVTATVAADIPAAVTSLTATVDGVTSPYAGPITISRDGNHTLSAQVTDVGGGVAATAQITVKLDQTAPAVTGSAPANGATGVVRSSTVTVNYTENIAKGGVFSGITLSTSAGAVPVTVKIAGKSLSVKSVSTMVASKLHTLTIPAGAIVDVAGNPAPAFTLTFTTGTK